MSDKRNFGPWVEFPELRDVPCLGRELKALVGGLSELTHRRLSCEIRPRLGKAGVEYAGVLVVRNSHLEHELFVVPSVPKAQVKDAVANVKKILKSDETRAALVALLEVARMA